MILNAFFRRNTSFYLLSVFDSCLNQDFAPSAAFNADILAMGAVKIWQGIQLLVNAFLNNPHQARHGRRNTPTVSACIARWLLVFVFALSFVFPP